MRARSNNISIDGLDNNDEYTGSSRIELSPEIVQEFQVVNNGLSAESGGASGRLDQRDDAYRRQRDSRGRLHFPSKQRAQCARSVRQRTRRSRSFGVIARASALGGPIVKDRTFYYVAVEQENNRGQNGSDIDPRYGIGDKCFLAGGAFPRLATRQITTDFFPISRAETEAAAKLNHQLTNHTSLMVRTPSPTITKPATPLTPAAWPMPARAAAASPRSAIIGVADHGLWLASGGRHAIPGGTRARGLRTNDSNGPEIDIAGLVISAVRTAGSASGAKIISRELHLYAHARTDTFGRRRSRQSRTIEPACPMDSGASIFSARWRISSRVARSVSPGLWRAERGFPVTARCVSCRTTGRYARAHARPGRALRFRALTCGIHQDDRDVSPRIGLAWSPSRQMGVARGLRNIFDRYVLADLARAMEKNGSQGTSKWRMALQRQIYSRLPEAAACGSGGGDCAFHLSSRSTHWRRHTASRPAPARNT